MPTIITRGAASARAMGLFKAVSGALTDTYFKYVTMLLPGNGTNGAQNNTFLDSSTNNFTITRNGNTTQGTFTPYGSNWSNYTNNAAYNSGGNYLSVATNAAFGFGTGDFTAEAWVYTNDTNNQDQCVIDFRDGTNTLYFYIRSTATQMLISTNVGTTSLSSSGSAAQWVHVAIARQGTSFRCFINGSLIQTFTDSTNYQATAPVRIGQRYTTGPDALVGYISNLRVVKGTAVYTAAFTPSTTPLTAISGTSLLTCQSNRFIDNSTNAFAITVTGSPSVQRFSPFSPSAAYSTTTNGGSAYFDGTGDNLVSAASATLGLGSGAFTIEGWFYRTATGDRYLLDYGPESSNRISIIVFSNKLQVYDTGYRDSGLTVPLNQWNHFAIVRSGTTVTPYVNGVAGTTYTDSRNLAKTATWYVASDDTNALNITAYMADVRVVVGTAVYTGAFTPPTAPLTAITNTQLLLNMTNAGIIDNAMMNDLETVGNAQISTTQSKFGGSSMYFDGTGDWLYGPSTPNVGFGTGPFTVEMWVYPTSNPANGPGTLFDARSGTNAEGWVLRIFSDLSVGFYDGPNNLYQQTTANAVSLNTWAYLAFVRSGTTLTIYVNGTSAKTATVSSNLGSSWPYYVGNNYSAGYTYYGYIDDLRITKGYARTITASPTAAFPTS